MPGRSACQLTFSMKPAMGGPAGVPDQLIAKYESAGTLAAAPELKPRWDPHFWDDESRSALPSKVLSSVPCCLPGTSGGSIILTSNKDFVEWGEVLGGIVIASAVLDRLLHHSHVLNIRGESFRLKEKRQAGIFSSHHLLGATPANGNDNYLD